MDGRLVRCGERGRLGQSCVYAAVSSKPLHSANTETQRNVARLSQWLWWHMMAHDDICPRRKAGLTLTAIAWSVVLSEGCWRLELTLLGSQRCWLPVVAVVMMTAIAAAEWRRRRFRLRERKKKQRNRIQRVVVRPPALTATTRWYQPTLLVQREQAFGSILTLVQKQSKPATRCRHYFGG